MATERCSECGHDYSADAGACPACGCPLNGAASPGAGDAARRPTPAGAPPSEKLSPELLEWARQQLSEEEFAAWIRSHLAPWMPPGR